MTAIAPSPELVNSRPTKAILTEIMVMSLVWVVLLQMIITVPSIELERRLDIAAAAGEVVLEHIGWGFGVFVPILLGFYAIAVGGQLTGTPTAAKRQRDLGLVAEAMVSALVPALILILVACITRPQLTGSLFVIVPASAVTLFLAVQLGGFIIFERELVLASASRSRNAASELLSRLRLRSRRPIRQIATVNAAAALSAVLVIDTLGPGDSVMDHPEVLALYLLLVVFVTGANIFAVSMVRSSTGLMDKAGGWLIAAAASLTAISVGAAAIPVTGVSAAAGLLLALALLGLSALPAHRSWPKRFFDWTIQGAGTRQAAKIAARSFARATRTIREHRQESSARTLRDRFRSALSAWESSS